VALGRRGCARQRVRPSAAAGLSRVGGQGRATVAVRAPVREAFLELLLAPGAEDIVFDYASTGLTLRCPRWHCCGLVTLRQQPQTAKDVIFVSQEDETGMVQVIVYRRVRERQRAALAARGRRRQRDRRAAGGPDAAARAPGRGDGQGTEFPLAGCAPMQGTAKARQTRPTGATLSCQARVRA